MSAVGPQATRSPAPVVVVVGSVNVDVVLRLPRLPTPGQTVTGGSHGEAEGGKGGNQAVAAARLGARTHLVARVGDDEHGRQAVRSLAGDGVRTEHVLATPGERTGLAAVLVDAASENLIGVSSGANARLSGEDVETALAAVDAEHAVVVACLEVPVGAVLAAGRAARRRGWPFVLNPAPAQALPPELLDLVTVLTPNEHEVGEVGSDVEGLLAAGADAVVTTLGPRGAEVAEAGRREVLPGHRVDAVDTTGARDTFTGALARAMAGGAGLAAAVRYAGVAAALSTRAHGARGGAPTHAEVLGALG